MRTHTNISSQSITLQPSRFFTLGLVVLQVVLVLIWASLPMNAAARVICACLWLLQFFWAYRSYRQYLFVQGIMVEGETLAIVKCGVSHEVVLTGALLSGLLSILYVKIDNKSETVLLFFDSADANDLRRLRLWLQSQPAISSRYQKP